MIDARDLAVVTALANHQGLRVAVDHQIAAICGEDYPYVMDGVEGRLYFYECKHNYFLEPADMGKGLLWILMQVTCACAPGMIKALEEIIIKRRNLPMVK